MKALLLATLAINLLSAYIRLHEAGLDCADWPACYGRVGDLIQPPGSTPVAALTPTDTAKRAHRAIATGLVVLVLLVVYQARQQKPVGAIRYLPYAIVAVVLLLAVIGPASYLKTLPAIATANLAGGMTLLALVWWLLLIVRSGSGVRSPRAGGLARLSLVVLIVQLLLGAWVSANFAATACQGLFDCPTPGNQTLISSFWYLRELELTDSGRIEIGASQALIQWAHHLGAGLTSLILVSCAVLSLRAGGQTARWGGALLVLLVLQIILGLTMLELELPLLVAVAHNLLASLLLLTVIRLNLLPLPANAEPTT